ncbi:MAG: radical SAM protein [archaeon]
MQAYFIEEYRAPNVVRAKNLLTVHFAGCNYRCPSCNVPDTLEFKEEFLQDLRVLKKRITDESRYVDMVLLTGGEPTLQRQALLDICRLCRKLELKIALDTNGSKPNVLQTLLEKSYIDYLILDLKAPADEALFQRATKSQTFFLITRQIIDDIKASIRIIGEHKDKIQVEVRSLVVPGIVYRKEDLEGIGEMARPLECRWNLVQFWSNEGKVLGKSMQGVNPPTEKFLQTLQETLQKSFPELQVGLLFKDDFLRER